MLRERSKTLFMLLHPCKTASLITDSLPALTPPSRYLLLTGQLIPYAVTRRDVIVERDLLMLQAANTVQRYLLYAALCLLQ